MKEFLELVKADPRYQKNIEYEPADEAHPEGKIKFHIADLEANLEILAERGISESDYWKLNSSSTCMTCSRQRQKEDFLQPILITMHI